MKFAVVITLAALNAAAMMHGAHAHPSDMSSITPPPASPGHASSSTRHGIRVNDPYRWLEDGDSPTVTQWIKAQNKHTEQTLAAMHGGKTMARRVRQLAITSTTRSAPTLAGGTLFYLEETPPQPQPVLMARPWPNGEAQVLVDLNKTDGQMAITDYWPSPDGRHVAYGTARGGSELTTIHVLDVDTGNQLADTLPRAGGGTSAPGLAWDADSKGFIYVRFPAPQADGKVVQLHAAVVHHALNQSADDDRVIFGKHYSSIAEYTMPASHDGRHRAILVKAGDGDPWQIYLHRDGKWRQVMGRQANVRGAAWDGDRLLVQSFQDAPRGKVMAIHADSHEVHQVLAQRKGALQQLAPIGNGFLVVRSWGPDWWAEQYDAGGKQIRRLPLPAHGISIGRIASEAGRDKALITYSGWTKLARWDEYDASTGSLETLFKVKPAADYRQVQATYIEGTSRDGTRIPVTVLHMRGIDADGTRPTILYSYGGFDLPVRPGFVGPYLAWLERGGVLAYANIRGGNENGQSWHEEGTRRRKQNVFDDFHAAARALETAGWTDRDHLGITGTSNGGLLMGAQVVEHPEAYRAVVSNVGIYDMIRHETQWTNGKYNVPEYGTIKNAEQFKATLAYSPLQNVKPHTAYPAMLMTTGVNDPRVAPWQSRKFTAALQNATTSDRPILLLTRMHAGHGIDASFAQRVDTTAVALTFFAHELGLRKL